MIQRVDQSLGLVVALLENGEYIKVFAPKAYVVEEHRAPVFALACAMIQWKTKMIQFEYDPSDGEVRPIIEFPLEDAELTQKQLLRCVSGIVQLVEEYDYVLREVQETGQIVFREDTTLPTSRFDALLDALPAEALRAALRRKS